jgi:uncharacterized protein YgbK (DUF1537 family)
MLVVADDATGALEAGAILARPGEPSPVYLDAEDLHPAQGVRVVLLPTRHDTAPAARQRVETAFAQFAALPGADATRLYWKTDSTLRGPIAACFAALRIVFPHRPIVYIPAYPALGRTVRDGILLVDQIPVTETAFAGDARSPVIDARVTTAAGADIGLPVHSVSDASELAAWLQPAAQASPTAGIAVCDAETEPQVTALVAACLEAQQRGYCSPIVAGPAGGVRPWCGQHLPLAPQSALLHPIKRWLVLCGSRHPVSIAQAEAARASGFDVLAMPEMLVDNPESELCRIAQQAASASADGILIFGGDTALTLWRTMGLRSVNALGELLPGVALSRAAGLTFVTKAGGFGPPDLAAHILRIFESAKGTA